MTVLQWAGPYEHSEIDGYFPHSLFLPQCLSVPLFQFLTPTFKPLLYSGAKPLFGSGRRFNLGLILGIFAQ